MIMAKKNNNVYNNNNNNNNNNHNNTLITIFLFRINTDFDYITLTVKSILSSD